MATRRTDPFTLSMEWYGKMPTYPSALPSFEWYSNNNQLPQDSLFFSRLRWDPFSSPDPEKSIAVIEDVTNAHSRQIGYSTTHPIANEPATDPLVSSITIIARDLNMWEYNWFRVGNHLEHSLKNPSAASWRPNSRHPFDDDGHGNMLVRCACGKDRPPTDKVQFEHTVYATSQPFVTVNDYITSAHAYFQAVRANIFMAKIDNYYPEPTLYFWPQSIRSPTFIKDTPKNDASNMDWESLADKARSRIHQITVNYLYNTFPPALPCWEWTVYAQSGTESTLMASNTIKGSPQKAQAMHFNWYPPASMYASHGVPTIF